MSSTAGEYCAIWLRQILENLANSSKNYFAGKRFFEEDHILRENSRLRDSLLTL